MLYGECSRVSSFVMKRVRDRERAVQRGAWKHVR